MKFKELKPMGKAELEEKMGQLEMDLIKNNAQVATGTTPKSPGQLKQIKKSIAKIKALLAEKAEEKKE
jgi:large subunit ribosomal protein L29